MSAALVKEIVAERPAPTFSRCSYCGAPCTGRACGSHRVLLVLDPHFQLERKEARP